METISSWLASAGRAVVASGPVPRHVAFIMDGNRRYAQKMSVARVRGHEQGFEKLKQTLEWCLEYDIRMVTVYAFSIENFKRSEDEVAGLMRLAEEKFEQLLEKNDLIEKHNVKVRVLGDVAQLPPSLLRVMGRAVLSSRHNTRLVLNVCFAYTAREEIAHAVNDIHRGLAQGLLEEGDVTEDLISQSLYTEDAPEPDLLIRTSGEVRLSDFLLWQTAYSCLSFQSVLWPEFSQWHLMRCVLEYQQTLPQLQAAKAAAQSRQRQQAAPSASDAKAEQVQTEAEEQARAARVARFLVWLHEDRLAVFQAALALGEQH